MTPAESLRELLTLAARPNGVVFGALQSHHRQQIPTAVRQRLIRDGHIAYSITDEGRRFIGPRETAPTPGKNCPSCHQDKDADEYWRDPARSDGLFYYCITCESNRRKEKRAMKREQLAAIRTAGAKAAAAAADWDAGVQLLAKAWTAMTDADTSVRLARAAGATDCDWGNLDLRLMHQAASYVMAKRLLAARYPWAGSFLHNDAMPDSMTAWMGDNPAEPYAGKQSEEIDHEVPEGAAGTAERGQAEGHAEQDHSRGPLSDSEGGGTKRRGRAPVARGN